MTAEEWQAFQDDDTEVTCGKVFGEKAEGPYFTLGPSGVTVEYSAPDGAGYPMDARYRHALAALCLYGQPFGFSYEMVDTILDVALYEVENGTYPSTSPWSAETLAVLRSLASRIESLLPPAPRLAPSEETP